MYSPKLRIMFSKYKVYDNFEKVVRNCKCMVKFEIDRIWRFSNRYAISKVCKNIYVKPANKKYMSISFD